MLIRLALLVSIMAGVLLTSCSVATIQSNPSVSTEPSNVDSIDGRIASLLGRMTLEEKIGQMVQVNWPGGGVDQVSDDLRAALRAGQIGSLLNVVDAATADELQRLATEDSRNGIPLLLARDVIHGFNTILPLPLGQAASWNPELVRQGARIAALEAAGSGVNWTFAPMIDVTRDPRWGRIAETFGEDPFLSSALGVAMIEGFQGSGDRSRLADPGTIAACAKHFAGYGASEAGRDYNTTSIPENELRNVYLPPFHAAVDAGVASLMTSFSDLNGVPASGNELLLQQILRDEWGFDGFVVSDWASIEQLVDHGLAVDRKQAARQAANAGVNMEMVSPSYADHLAELVEAGEVSMRRIDQLVGEVLRIKLELGLFDNPYTPSQLPQPGNDEHLAIAKQAAQQSLVLLQNNHRALPLNREQLNSIAVIGPMADDEYEQLGTWVFDADTQLSRTPLEAIQALAGSELTVRYVKALATTRDRSTAGLAEARRAAERSDAVLVFVGEESILSGEAHSRANIDLPGAQIELLEVLRQTGKPVIAVVLAGRPLTIENVLDDVDALIYAWHPGSMGGPAIADVLFGQASPSGKLPVTFPKLVGQIPIYYAQKNTGKPATPETYVHFDDLPVRGFQAAFGMTSHHLDAGYTPLFPFGFGLSYTTFEYADIKLSATQMPVDGQLRVEATVRNSGNVEADEIVQFYVRDLVGNVTRPIKELKGFQRVRLKAGQQETVGFELRAEDLTFYDRNMKPVVEPGEFHVWIGGNSGTDLKALFTITP